MDAHRDRPKFLYLHYRDVHAPYDPPPELRNFWWRPPAGGGEGGLRRLSAEELERMPEYMRIPDAPPYLEFMVAQYDAEIRYTDGKLCELLAGLRARGELERSILLLTSDHGEAFLEHGVWNHGNELFEEEIRKSYEEYTEQVGREIAETTGYFREALNEILAGGRQVF